MYKTRFFFFVILLVVGSLLFPYLLHADDSQQNSVTASVAIPPRAENFQLQISSLDHQQTTIPPGVTQTYQITYGALKSAAYSTTNTLIANYDDSKILGSMVVDYVAGSATNAYGNAYPIIDTINHTITWQFTMPANNPDQTVSFQLRTNDHYTGTQTIPIKVIAQMSNEYVTLTPVTVQQTYSYTGQLTPVPTTPTPTQPAPVTTTPSPTPATSVTPKFSNISFTGVSQSNAAVNIQTSEPSSVTIAFGTSPNSLTNVVASTTLQSETTIALSNLLPETKYYFKITAVLKSGKTIVSDIYTFKTASVSKPAEISQLVVTSADTVLYAPDVVGSLTTNGTPQLILPNGTAYQLTIRIDNAQDITSIHAIVKNSQVLGISTPAFAEGVEYEVPITQTEPGVFVVSLTTPKIKSLYGIFVRIFDKKGNLTEKKIADLRSASALFVLEKNNHTPIEHARILLFKRNDQTNKFEQIPLTTSFPNPIYTDSNGEISPILKKGIYRAQISALGFENKNITFTLGTGAHQDYPTILLIRKPFSIQTSIIYYLTTLSDTLLSTRAYVLGLSQSVRFFELNALIVTLLFIGITLFAFSEKIHIPVPSFPAYFFHIGKIRMLQKKLQGKIYGRVVDKETQAPIPDATIYLIDAKKKSILGHTTTNASGAFSFTTLTSNNYALSVLKTGFRPTVVDQSDIRAVGTDGYILSIHQHLHEEARKEEFEQFFKRTISVLFETLLIISFIFEISIGFTFGIEKAMLFICFSMVNVFLWIFHLTHLHSLRHSF